MFDTRAIIATRIDTRFMPNAQTRVAIGKLSDITVGMIQAMLAQNQSHAAWNNLRRRIRDRYHPMADRRAAFGSQLEIMHGLYMPVDQLSSSASLAELMARLRLPPGDYNITNLAACFREDGVRQAEEIRSVIVGAVLYTGRLHQVMHECLHACIEQFHRSKY